MERRKFLEFVSSFDLPCKKLHKLFEFYDEQEISFDILDSKDFACIVGKETSEKMKAKANLKYIETYEELLYEKGIKLITFEDECFPQKLVNLEDAPYFLFCKGDVSLLGKPSISIVGSRMPSSYGKIVTERFAGTLAENGLVIISGLAYGVDSIAHRKALDVGGKTIAVLGGGFSKIYPSEHTNLAEEIEKKGLLVTEYSLGVLPTKYTFPQRNRIVAGLSDGVLITEAGAKSGTMITKDYALDNGINIYAVPGNITSSKSEGTNNIIAHSQGMCVLEAKDILDDLGIQKNDHKTSVQLSIEEQLILNLLEDGDKDFDFLAEKSGINVNKLSSLLVSLEIRDIIKKMAGGVYAIS